MDRERFECVSGEIHTDEALTGTKENRPEFQRLLADCRAGLIDMVITKSISRFARNTVTLLATVRELKALGVDVFFEKENLHSMSGDGELMLTILASYAQEESRSVSENCKWRIRKSYEAGKPVTWRFLYGYRIRKDEIIVHPKEAEIVREVFDAYLRGVATADIAASLREREIPCYRGGNWTPKRVIQLLRNEKYAGNVRLQQRFVTDHLSKKTQRNIGQLPTYFAEGTHQVIISPEAYQQARDLMERNRLLNGIECKAPQGGIFTGMITCGYCGKHYKRKSTHGKIAWNCTTYLMIRATLNGSDYHRIETGVYTHVDYMDLPDSEGEKVIDFVTEQLQSKDYVIANELDLSCFETLNPHCPFSAIRDAVFYKFLANRYSKSGQVITRIGEKLRVLDILEQYCREAETVSFEELNSFEATFDPDGKTHSACLVAAYNVMARVSSDLFVAESKVNFDVDKTDEALALYCRDNFIPLKKVMDFSLFPYAGYPWNLFLLESYVRKFSRMFKYDVRAANSANIGVIVRRSFTYGEYDDILAIALAKSSVSLNNKKAIGNYLFDNGYIGWRNLSKSEGKILANAKRLREVGAF